MYFLYFYVHFSMANPFLRFKSKILSADEMVMIIHNAFPDCKVSMNPITVHRLNPDSGKMEACTEYQIIVVRDEKTGVCLEVENNLLYAKPHISSGKGLLKFLFSSNASAKEFCKDILKAILPHT